MIIRVVADVGGDWSAVYVDGELYAEGHSISDWSWERLLEKLGAEIYRYESSFPSGRGEPNWGEMRQNCSDL